MWGAERGVGAAGLELEVHGPREQWGRRGLRLRRGGAGRVAVMVGAGPTRTAQMMKRLGRRGVGGDECRCGRGREACRLEGKSLACRILCLGATALSAARMVSLSPLRHGGPCLHLRLPRRRDE